jgi:DNA-binding SARP family transcriptional activator
VAALELRLLGDLEVIRGGVSLPLPPSKKTRALLAYLALHARSFRREHLCELLWEIPDDPRGSLRWSLSKLRRLVDDEDRPRIVADRSHVGFDAEGVAIDVSELRRWAASDLDRAAIEDIEDVCGRVRGHFLEGLDLPNFHDFHAWCVGEREQTARDRTTLLGALIARLADEPARALPHARALVAMNPYDEGTRATLIRLLVALGRGDEAEQQFRLGTRMLEEIRLVPSGALVAAWRGAAAPRRTSAPATVPPPTRMSAPVVANSARDDALVGRDAEAQMLHGELSTAANRRCARVILLAGKPGIGKTALLRVLDEPARASGALVLRASAIESEAIRPFALWIDALRGVAEGAALLHDTDLGNRDRLFDRLRDLVLRESQTRPVVIVFDDLQWCDESSVAALHYVTRTLRDRPLLGVLAARDDELKDNAAVQQALRGLRHDGLLREFTLAPLDATAVEHLIAAHAPGADTAALGRACNGNPLIAIELARAITSGENGSSLDELVLERLARCDVEVADVIRWAAVLAPRFDVARLARVTGLDEERVGHALDVAERHTILQLSERGFRFPHDLVARFVYNDISPVRRRVMHRRIADLLERDTALDLEVAADLAHHATQSGDPGLAARAMVSAGRLCLRFFANDEALALARKGLNFAAQLADAERVRITLDLRDVMLTAAPVTDWQATAAELVALAEQALDHGALGHARLGYQLASDLRWAHGHWRHARDATLQAERVARHAGDEDQIVGMAESAKCLAMLERDLPEAEALLLEARALAGRSRLRVPAIPAGLGMLRFYENRLDEAEALFHEARALYKSAGDRVGEFQANEYLVMIDVERGRYDLARARCGELLAIGEKLRDGSEAPFARALEALCRYAEDDDAGALDAAFEALRIADAKHRLASALSRTAWIDLERGRHGAAIERAEEALTCAEALERPTEQLLAHVILAHACAESGDPSGCERHRTAIAALETTPVAEWARERAQALAARGPRSAKTRRRR